MSLKCFVLQNEPEKEARVKAVEAAVREYLNNNEVTVEENEKGKWLVNGTDSPLYLSVAPAGDKLLAAVKETPVGIDGERLSDFEGKRADYGMLAERFLSGEEAEYVRDGDTSADERDRFLKIWTRKKAYVKYFGKTVSDFPTFSVVDGDRILPKVGSVTIRKFSIAFEGSENYLFAIAGV